MPESNEDNSYLLGVNQQELERLQFQHSVWGHVTKKFLDRLNVGKGWRCLDVGAGPGLVSMDLRELVCETGEVTALDPSQFYLECLRRQAGNNGWTNVQCVQGTAESADLPLHYYDLIFVRWVIAFVPDPEKFLIPLFSSLRTGGILAIQDYYYEGLSLFPRGGVWDTMPDIVRAYYRSGGGDAYVAGRIPTIFRKHGLNVVDFTPNCLAGGPTSGVMEWAHRFLSTHVPLMAQKGLISSEQAEGLMVDWNTHRQNPDAVFFSPLVVDIAGSLSR
jgi:ubiquinone/menaquinone biosynthesis C-methylase UbiE